MRIPMKPCYIISHLAADVSTGEYVALTQFIRERGAMSKKSGAGLSSGAFVVS